MELEAAIDDARSPAPGDRASMLPDAAPAAHHAPKLAWAVATALLAVLTAILTQNHSDVADTRLVAIAVLLGSAFCSGLVASYLLVCRPVAYVLVGCGVAVYAMAIGFEFGSKLLVMYLWMGTQFLVSNTLWHRPRAFKAGFALLWPIQFVVFPFITPADTPLAPRLLLVLTSSVLAAYPATLPWQDGLQLLHDKGHKWANWCYPRDWLDLDFEVYYNLWFCSFWCLQGEYGLVIFLVLQANYFFCERVVVRLSGFGGDSATLWPSVRPVSAAYIKVLPALDELYAQSSPMWDASCACSLLFLAYVLYRQCDCEPCVRRWCRR